MGLQTRQQVLQRGAGWGVAAGDELRQLVQFTLELFEARVVDRRLQHNGT